MPGAPSSPSATAESHRKKLSSTQALFRAEQRYREILLGLPVACYTLDREGVIDFYNEAAVALWGRAPELGRERWCGSLRLFTTGGNPLPHDKCPAAIALKEQRSVRGIEAVVQRPDGTERWFIPHPDPLFDSDGNCSGVINVLVDVTDQRQAQQALKLAKDAAVAANRSKDRFLAVLSHELRTPLTPILLTASLREDDPSTPPELREEMATIRRNIERETKLIDELLDHS
ncbi:MAG: histidine kinase dimerization/phospho-acceptor domain-containing protein, partial [Chthoniobacterales bacterium]